MQFTIENVKSIAEIIQAIIASVAIIVAGYWSYKLFIKKDKNMLVQVYHII